ncbi:MAG: type I restriction-modification system subunit M N-terminal domain-containing protein [Treponema sp.]|nr:type I restriction-modification system subunit M N-terminal domain-containing protein [Treponema sp.]
MLTGELRSKVDRLWTTFWTGGIANPLTVIEQISYLLFIKRLSASQDSSFERAMKDNVFLIPKPSLLSDANPSGA